MVVPQAAILLRFFSKELRFAFNLWMALGGMVVPQLAATSAHPGFFRPGLTGMRLANWRQQNQNKIDWDTRLVRRASANCAELILWTSQTGD
jgi:hypothetical protein